MRGGRASDGEIENDELVAAVLGQKGDGLFDILEHAPFFFAAALDPRSDGGVFEDGSERMVPHEAQRGS